MDKGTTLKRLFVLLALVLFTSVTVQPIFAEDSSWSEGADINGDGSVDYKDLAILTKHWLKSDPNRGPNITWVDINDPGISGHEGFVGQMSKYETTNAQFAKYLNDALASGDIVIDDNYVEGNSGPYSGQNYYRLDGGGLNLAGAPNGGAARINWTGSSFTVDSGFENHPVTYVSWYGSMSFASYYGWRLPTELEWQAVADYNGSFTYGCGTSINNSIANYSNSTHPHGTTPVGQFGTYGYGMADMAGNVVEWTNSLWDPAYSYRVVRGGSWVSSDKYCTVSYRLLGASYPFSMLDDIGFRVCR